MYYTGGNPRNVRDMSYWMMDTKVGNLFYAENMNKYSDQIQSIREELDQKYPLYNGCCSWNERQKAGDSYKKDAYGWRKEYSTRTREIFARRHDDGLTLLQKYCTPMLGKRKADLVRECAVWMKRTGVQSAIVYNYTFQDGEFWVPTQSWYVYEEDGGYFFKMYEKCKTSHKIEGVA